MTVHEGLPRTRTSPFDPPAELGRIRESEPVTTMTYPDGHEGWLITGYAEVRAALADPRLSSRPENAHSPIPMDLGEGKAEPPRPGMFTSMDDPDHARYRKLLTGAFTVRRMRLLESRVAEITASCLDEVERTGPPADLVPTFALPIPSAVICELLGVPADERPYFQRRSAEMFDLDMAFEERMTALGELGAYLAKLTRDKHAEPGDDLLGDLLAGGQLTDEELGNIAVILLIAGHETTGNMLSLGAFTLLSNPDQLAVLRAEPELAGNAVEELMRYLSVIHIGPIRTATEDVEIGGRTIRAGDSVTFSVPAANRDPRRFDDPDTLDLRRRATGHVGFGHGVHQCLGQQLARVEMTTALPALFRRFPDLRLAVPAAEVVTNNEAAIYGVGHLPVEWETVAR
ncbi:cytochrome P450 [Amycolatopsis antarctica]|uniref:Cytochrome P450 n=1 Tax=Amycolatopsis antarctica TaxID=1854586 RepID=A0A263D1M3_9PSEU|nr:cytochrome P450 [Amycolatopsis antarctica]OZM71416.1 cytochrome P450 [Amycolatopsis antarctica]